MAKTMLLAILSILLVGSIIVQPDASFQASLQGLTVWWNIVFPGLLPFLVLYEMILAFGLAHAFGAVMQPIARRVFKLPGEAALALVFGWLGGYPAGSEAVASLRKRGIVSRSQGQRLLAYAHMPNPLFMLVIIGAGFLHKPLAGMLIAAAVWASALGLLLLSALLSRREPHLASSSETTPDPPRRSLLAVAAGAMQKGRDEDGRSFGKVLGDSVAASVQKLMVIGGLMIFSAVLAKLAEPMFALFAKLGLPFIGQALFESHLGSYAAATWNAPGVSIAVCCAAIAAILAWSGLSGILQAGYMIAGTDLKLAPLIAHRLIHAALAFMLTLLLWQPLGSLLGRLASDNDFPVLYADYPLQFHMPPGAIAANALPSLWHYSTAVIGTVCLAVLVLYAAIQSHSRIRRNI